MRVTLVLGSGGARGYAHIGAIEELQRRGHEVVAISGCSMGSVVGGMLATGKLAEFTALVRRIETRDILLLLDPALGSPGMIKAGRIMDMLGSLLGPVNMEDLPIPMVAVAADVTQRREVWFQSGPLLTAIRASIAIPTAFTPIVRDGRLLVDGGLLNPLPIQPAALFDSDLTVAVSLYGRDPGTPAQYQVNQGAGVLGHRPDTPLGERIRGNASGLLEGAGELLGGAGVRALFERFTGRDHDPDAEDAADATARTTKPAKTATEPDIAALGRSPEPLPQGLNTRDMMIMSLSAMQMSIEAARTALNPPDVLVSIPVDACGAFDFHRADPMIELGRERTAAALDAAGL